tara:strand:- start:301 stop:663 length:363 start_codon:yes stop_codon:yes gene_type:complete
MHIGNKLRYLIESKGFTKRDFAYLLETSEQNLHKILNKESIQISQLIAFCELLKVHPNLFFENLEIGLEASESEVSYDLPRDFASKNIESTVIRLLQDLVKEKDERIRELQDHINSLKRQ